MTEIGTAFLKFALNVNVRIQFICARTSSWTASSAEARKAAPPGLAVPKPMLLSLSAVESGIVADVIALVLRNSIFR